MVLNLKDVTQLESLHLDFSRFEAFDDTVMQSLGEILKRLISLRFIHLQFVKVNSISDQGLASVSGAITKLDFLEEIIFYTSLCPKTTYDMKDKMKEDFVKKFPKSRINIF